MQLDDIHIGMVDLLRRNGRLSIAALAEQLGISRSNAYQRYDWLIETGVITGFTATLDFRAAGFGVAALVFVSLEQNQWGAFRERLPTVPELEYFAVTAGAHDGMLLVRAADVAAIHELVAMNLAQWPSIKSTETVFVMDEQWDRVSLGAGFAGRALRSPGEWAGESPLGSTRHLRIAEPGEEDEGAPLR
ncbi:Lrp/AsnC family transcriptional regulator [Mycetocola tolaasinivorans]|uniref:Lrp/AsnC family transcriptional regulator n=1 Tax=Mycetocola tolaasinivorans TaxID=76635 RepID=A0A3L7A982_9MICO|nr:Lrp/AsnC family transcriptional regulator [Mycetocola tolaasinivorans]RLP76400.1 Lrp/AsnC family transcriptional regulator [Mycetocola tolaasinivorans]